MSARVYPPRVLGWLAAGALFFAVVGGTCLPGCAALTAAAPTLLDGAERILVHELDRAEEDARAAARTREIEQALALLRETRAAQAAAEDAARRATEAAALAQAGAARAAEERRLAEQARRDAAIRQLAPLLARLGVTARLRAQGAASSAASASPGSTP